MDTNYIEEPMNSKWNPIARSSRFQHLGIISGGAYDEDYDDNASLGAQTLVTLEEGVRHALSHWKIIVLGQILSFLTASSGAAQAGLHLECNVSAPFLSIAMTFFVLSFFLIPLYRGQTRVNNFDDTRNPELFGMTLRAPVAVYFLLAAMEIQASYWTISAFRYTTITSITLLDAISLPTVMILSRFMLKRRYIGVHVLGALVCLVGACINMFADYTSQTAQNAYPKKVVGDFFAVSGAVMMGVIHVYSEVLVSDVSGPVEYIAVVGFFAFPMAFAASLIFERTESVNVFQNSECSAGLSSLLVIVSVLTKCLDMALTAGFLYVSEAALLNLSLLTTDLWSAIFSVLVERIVPPPLFWMALIVVFLGIFIYEMGPSPAPHTHELHLLEDWDNDKHEGGAVEIT